MWEAGDQTTNPPTALPLELQLLQKGGKKMRLGSEFQRHKCLSGLGTYPTKGEALLSKPSINPADSCKPVSLFPLASNTTDRVISKQATDILSHNDLLDPKQSAFKSCHSIEMSLLSVALKAT